MSGIRDKFFKGYCSLPTMSLFGPLSFTACEQEGSHSGVFELVHFGVGSVKLKSVSWTWYGVFKADGRP